MKIFKNDFHAYKGSKIFNCLLQIYRTSSVWWHHGFLQIITVAFLLILAPAGQPLTLIYPNLTCTNCNYLKKTIMSPNRRGPIYLYFPIYECYNSTFVNMENKIYRKRYNFEIDSNLRMIPIFHVKWSYIKIILL